MCSLTQLLRQFQTVSRLRLIILFVFSVLCIDSIQAEMDDLYQDATTIEFTDPEHVFLETHKIVLVDDGSTGSRVMSFCFGRDSTEEQFRLVKQSPMINASILSPDIGGIDDKSAQAIARLLADKTFCPSVNPNSEKPVFFLGATAGKRANSKDVVSKTFKMIKDKLNKLGVEGQQYDIRLQVLEGWEEGAYNWLAANKFYGRLNSWKDHYGIVELGGKSAQMAFSLLNDQDLFSPGPDRNSNDSYELASNDHGYLNFSIYEKELSGFTLFSESKMGFGLNQAIKDLKAVLSASNSDDPCIAEDDSVAIYEECKAKIESLFESREDKSKSFKSKQASLYKKMPRTFYLSGYFYDFTVSKGLHSHLLLSQLEEAARFACENFTLRDLKESDEKDSGASLFDDFQTKSPINYPRVVTSPDDATYSGSIPRADNTRLCSSLTYMVTLLEQLGVGEDHQLVILKAYRYEGKPYPATWSPGCAYALVNGFMPEKTGASEEVVQK